MKGGESVMSERKRAWKLILAAQILTMIFLLSAYAGAQDYSLEFSQFGISGGISQTADYEVLDIITDLGTTGGSQSSASYAFAPIIGFPEPTSAVLDWMLY